MSTAWQSQRFYLEANPRQRDVCHKLFQQCDTTFLSLRSHCHWSLTSSSAAWISAIFVMQKPLPTHPPPPPTHTRAPFLTLNDKDGCDPSHLLTVIIWILEGTPSPLILLGLPRFFLFFLEGRIRSSDTGLTPSVGACRSQ